MRHRIYGKQLNRDKNQRTALFRGLIHSLIIHESINTTQAKASAIKGLVDRLIVKSKQDSQASARVLQSMISEPIITKKLKEEIAPRYQSRNSGFTQVVRLGKRLGDGAMMVKISLIEADLPKAIKSQETKVEEKTEDAKVNIKPKARRQSKKE